MNTAQDTDRVYALLADGTTVEIREARPEDFDAVLAMHEAMAPDNIYLRFFSYSRRSAETEARRICRDPAPGNAALLALRDGELVGVASYAGLIGHPGQAEVAFAVADHMHHKGIATLLLEHLVSLARSRQITTFTADTLTENTAMLKVFADAGLPVQRHFADEVFELTFPLPRDEDGTALDTYLSAVAERESSADVASLRHIFAPESVVVIGASRRREAIGRVILENIRGGGYAGRLYTVNPRARQIDGERCLDSVLDLPEPADLAVIAVPAPAVLGVAEQCGQRGVRSLVVITSGLDAAACADLLAVCRRHGMRLVGPDCFGVAVPGLGLDATFAASRLRPGVAGIMSQSGGVGVALASQLSRLGVGISSFASVGSKLDVSGNDMLMWWEHDDVTRLAVLYLESFGNPRKFARTARRVGAKMPVLTVRAGHSAADQALFEQAGVIATGSFGELTETAALLAAQPVPAGRTVAIVSNVGGAGLLAAGACAELGLTVHQPHGLTRRRLRTLLPGGTVTGPVDTTAAISAEDFRRCLELLAADDGVDAMIALVQPTGANGDLITAIQDADIRVPLAAVVLDQAETVRLLPRPASPETTARFRSTTFRRRRPPRWPTRPGTGPGAPSRAARCPASPTSGPPTPARWSPGSCTASPAAAGCRPTRPPTCCTATGYGWSTPSRPAAKTRRSGSPRQCPAQWYSRPRRPGSCRTGARGGTRPAHRGRGASRLRQAGRPVRPPAQQGPGAADGHRRHRGDDRGNR